MSHTVADVIATSLSRHGVDFIFGQSNPTALMLATEAAGIRQFLYRTENAAGAMADAYSRVSNKIGVIAVQNGPAAALMAAPMAEAMKASIPMLVLVQEVPASQRDRNAFQEYDHFALFSGVSKWTRRLDDPNRAIEYIDQAMVAANSGRPGPVVLLLAKDMLMEPCVPKGIHRRQNLGTFPLDRPRPEDGAIKAAARLLAKATSPLVMAGGGVHSAQATSQLKQLVEVGKLPVATTNMGKGAVDETAPLSLGVAANFLGDNGPATAYRELIEKADVVLLIGTRTNENGTDSWKLTSPEATYIHIDVDPMEVGRNYESLRLLGDARSAIADLTKALENEDLSLRQQTEEAFKAQIAQGRAARKQAIAAECQSTQAPIMPQRLMTELDHLIRPQDIVVADASYSSAWVSCFLTAREYGQRFLTPRGLAGLGWGLPFGLGAKLARPDANIIAIVGDGGFAHVWAEVEMAVRENIPLTLIVLNNSQLVMQKHGEGIGFGRTTSAIEFCQVDHAAVARAAGAEGVRIDDPEQLTVELEKAMASDKVCVLDVISSPNAYAPLSLFSGDSEKFDVDVSMRAEEKGDLQI